MKNLLTFLFLAILFASTEQLFRRRLIRSRRCETHNCDWVWGSCSRTCGGGLQSPRITRGRGACGSCNLPASRQCNIQCCPVDCLWADWRSWSSCSATCGEGNSVRYRHYAKTPDCGGTSCHGPTSETKSCSLTCCLVNCEWGDWSVYNACSASCGGGNQTRNRSIEVQPSCGGANCTGSATQTQSCNDHCCPVNCRWDSWGEYGLCSATCGSGLKMRSRKLAEPHVCGGLPCAGEDYDHAPCNQNPCPVDCSWSEWSGWEECTDSCGGGSQTRNRSVAVAALHGGRECVGNSTEHRVCNDNCCPVDCAWTELSGLTECSLTCGIDVDKCMVSGEVCHGKAECNNTLDGFNCFCQDGYTGDGVNLCTDIDECQSDNMTICSNKNMKCRNLPGSFRCFCEKGFEMKNEECQKSIALSQSEDDDAAGVWKTAVGIVMGVLTALFAVMLVAWFWRKNNGTRNSFRFTFSTFQDNEQDNDPQDGISDNDKNTSDS